MNWFFGKQPPRLPRGPVPDWPPRPAPRDERGWNEDWQVGDLAQCRPGIEWCDDEPENPKPGDLLRVAGMTEGLANDGTRLVSALAFVGKSATNFWACGAFRKIRPDLTAAEDEFTAELRGKLGLPA